MDILHKGFLPRPAVNVIFDAETLEVFSLQLEMRCVSTLTASIHLGTRSPNHSSKAKISIKIFCTCKINIFTVHVILHIKLIYITISIQSFL